VAVEEVNDGKQAILALEDGTIFPGKGFGAEREVTGEVVFNTSMYGYPELLTDPSYHQQIVIMTYPILGSYGVPPNSLRDEFGVPLHFESDSIKVRGYGVHSLSKPSHWSSERGLENWLEDEGVPGICGIDTRALTQKLRVKGTMLGLLKVSSEPLEADHVKASVGRLKDPNRDDLVKSVTCSEPVFYQGRTDSTIAVLDCGVKFGIVRRLLAEGVSVVRVPYDYSADRILGVDPSGIVLSNGPGDPVKCERTIETTKQLLEVDLPVMGICLGAQILALAGEGVTYKLKFGHRAVNHPCMDTKTGRCYITTQNHGFSIDEKSLKNTQFNTSFVNVNDKTVEGIRHKNGKVFGVQWHPENSPGPHDTEFLFADFLEDALKP
jgi:carbamoyl-phosphate synthase small subunit